MTTQKNLIRWMAASIQSRSLMFIWNDFKTMFAFHYNLSHYNMNLLPVYSVLENILRALLYQCFLNSHTNISSTTCANLSVWEYVSFSSLCCISYIPFVFQLHIQRLKGFCGHIWEILCYSNATTTTSLVFWWGNAAKAPTEQTTKMPM